MSIEFNSLAEIGDMERIGALLASDPNLVFSKGSHGRTALHLAAYWARKEVAELLLASRAYVNARDDGGLTPLHSSVSTGAVLLCEFEYSGGIRDKEMVELLLAKHADVDARDNSGRAPLHYASINGDSDVAELLLAHKADVHAEDNGGHTPLYYAARPTMVGLLLSHGADVNARANDGTTPLHGAVLADKNNVAVFLLRKGADVNAKDNDGDTPWRLAEMQRNADMVKLLRQHGAGEGTSMQSTEKPKGRRSACICEQCGTTIKMEEKPYMSKDRRIVCRSCWLRLASGEFASSELEKRKPKYFG